MRKLVLVSVVMGSLFAAANAQAAIPNVFGVVTCADAGNQRQCGTDTSSDGGAGTRSTAPSWDGTPIDVKVAFPADPSPSTDGNYPLIIWGHGYGGSKNDISFSSMERFTDRGYAVFAMTARGFHQSCGKANAVSDAAGACNAAGWIHLMDDRYEIRDAQFFAGELADEGLVDGQRVGAIGGSYGGGLSMALAGLKDRVMLPDGSLVPWTSPGPSHHPMQIAAATPEIPWTDLAYSLDPNGGTLDYMADSPYAGRAGVEKLSFQTGLYLSGSSSGLYCGQSPYPSCSNFGSDVTAWKARLDAGEPYDGDPTVKAVLDEIKAHHSSYYIDHSEPPAPLLISNGFTDDLFPADEAIRYYNLIRSKYPDAPISTFFGDFGHMRAANKPAERAALVSAEDAWLDHYVKGTGPDPFHGATAFAMTCPKTDPSGGPFQASSWAGLQHGEVRLDSAGAKTIAPDGGSSALDATWDPVVAGGDPCTSAPGADQAGVATYRLPAAAGSGYTLMGSPTVVAKMDSPTANSELAARLLDVDPSGTQTLVDRQLFRPAVGSAKQVFQLHPSGHLFAAGHVAKLELLPKDAGGFLGGYGRPANGQGTITVSNLSFRIPVTEGPGAAGGQVKAAAPLLLPCGSNIAQQFSSDAYLRATLGAGKARVKGKTMKVPVESAPGLNPCKVKVQLLKSGKGKKSRSAKKRKKAGILGRGATTIPGGGTKSIKVKLTKRGRSAVRHGRFKVKVTTVDPAGNTVQIGKVKLSHGKKHKKK